MKTEQQKKIFLIFMIVILGICLYLSKGITNYHNNEVKSSSNIDLSSPVLLSENSDNTPKISYRDYLFEEYKILNNLISHGYIINNYKMIFTNTKKIDYDIENRYKDFNSDFKNYQLELNKAITDLQSLNPALDETKTKQNITINQLLRFYNQISYYNKHNSSLNDTLTYLNECQYELSRVQNLLQLPE